MENFQTAIESNPFYYFAYGAAVSEVIVVPDGEFKLLRTDIPYDAGNSINPAIDWAN